MSHRSLKKSAAQLLISVNELEKNFSSIGAGTPIYVAPEIIKLLKTPEINIWKRQLKFIAGALKKIKKGEKKLDIAEVQILIDYRPMKESFVYKNKLDESKDGIANFVHDYFEQIVEMLDSKTLSDILRSDYLNYIERTKYLKEGVETSDKEMVISPFGHAARQKYKRYNKAASKDGGCGIV